MKLSKQQFEELLKKNRLILSLIGMSNIGKTYWSKKLQDIGFRPINCDDLIETKLVPILKEFGYSGINDVSRWMGQPYDDRFIANQQKYLSLEKEAMKNIFIQIENEKKENIVVDTTGSVIHTGKDICANLTRCSLVVYIKATKNIKEEMFQQYIKEPKPVVFGDVFNLKKNEKASDALERSYRKLLDIRSALYTEYADVIILREIIKKNMNINQFISLIKQLL